MTARRVFACASQSTGFLTIIALMPPLLHKLSVSLFIAAALCSPLCEAQWFADLGVESSYVDNLTRSEHSSDAREDSTLALTARRGLHVQPGDFTGLTLTGTLTGTRFSHYTGLNNFDAGLSATLAHKFGIGERQPTLSAEFGIARNEYNLGIRDAWLYRVGVSVQKRLTDTFNLSGGLRYEKRDGDHDQPRNIPLAPRSGAPWDTSSRTLFISGELDLNETWWASATYQLQDGDVVSTAVSYPKIFNAATAITLDPLFGPLAVAYRIPALTHSIALDLNRAVFSSGTLYLGVEFQDTRGRNGIDYYSSLLRGGFIHSF